MDQVLPLEEINQVIVYTDQNRFWLADPLLDLAGDLGLRPKVSLLDELNDEEIVEIQHSFGILPDITLLAGIFSMENPVINKINQIFDPFKPPTGFKGYSILTQFQFPNQYFYHFMNQNIGAIQDREEDISTMLEGNPHFVLQSDAGTYLECTTRKFVSFPFDFSNYNHILFPSGEIVVEIEKLDGTIVVDRTIGPYFKQDELIDPMGRLQTGLEILIEDNHVVDFRGQEDLVSRIKRINNWDTILLNTISFGLYDYAEATGFLSVDRLATETATVSNPQESVEFHFTFDDFLSAQD